MVRFFQGFELPQDQPTIQATETEGGKRWPAISSEHCDSSRLTTAPGSQASWYQRPLRGPICGITNRWAGWRESLSPTTTAVRESSSTRQQPPRAGLAEVLQQPEQEPAPAVVAWSRKTRASRAIRCLNCRVRNYLPADFLESAAWMCHACAQPQTVIQAREHPAPTSLGEWVESFDAAAVDDNGALRWTPGAGAAAATTAAVKTDGLR